MKNIVIVGAGRGIGLQIAELLAATHHVIAISRQPSPELAALPVQFIEANIGTYDVTNLPAMPEEIHGIVYCPGSINLKPFSRLSADDFVADFRQNLLGAVSIIQKLLPALKRANGAGIVLFSSVAAKIGMPFHASVAASKAALEGLARSLAAELAPFKIRVNSIAPSLTDTSLAQPLLNTDEKREAAAKRHPLQRIGNAAEMAALAVFLLSNDGAWITGQTIGVDGGMGSLKT